VESENGEERGGRAWHGTTQRRDIGRQWPNRGARGWRGVACHVADRTGDGRRGGPVGHGHSARWQHRLTGGLERHSAGRREFKLTSKIVQTDLKFAQI
jgi:hypothetical protein